MQNGVRVNNRNITPHMWLFLKLAVLAFGTVLFKYYGGNYATKSSNSTENEITNNQENTSNSEHSTETKIDQIVLKKVIVQPTCPKSYLLVILDEICYELFFKSEFCAPEDVNNLSKHRIPKKYQVIKNKTSGSESQGSAVNGVLGALLAASVAAALLELHRARRRDGGGAGAGRARRQPPSRKCSLADLTVLKHQRRELVRRESVLEAVGEDGAARAGFRTPLVRRCSFPVGPLATIHRSDHVPWSATIPSRRSSIIAPSDSRRQSVVSAGAEPRRASVLAAERALGAAAQGVAGTPIGVPMNSRRVSVDADISPRHHSRLVHRH